MGNNNIDAHYLEEEWPEYDYEEYEDPNFVYGGEDDLDHYYDEEEEEEDDDYYDYDEEDNDYYDDYDDSSTEVEHE